MDEEVLWLGIKYAKMRYFVQMVSFIQAKGCVPLFVVM